MSVWLALAMGLVFGATAAEAVTLAERAGDAARMALVEQCLAQHLASGPQVAAVLAFSSPVEQHFRQAVVSSSQVAPPRPLETGGMEVDAWISAGQFSVALLESTSKYLPNLNPAKLVLAAGSPDSRIVATARLWDTGQSWCDLPGWRHCELQHIEWVKIAARLDYRQQLLQRLGLIRVSSQQSIGSLLLRHPKFADALTRRIEQLPIPEPMLEPVGLCRINTQMNRGRVIELLASAAADSGEKLDVDFTGIIEPGFQESVVVDGLAVAPPVSMTAPTATASRPAWTGRTLTAKAIGHASADIADRLQRQELAVTAARIEARRQLWIELEQLCWPYAGTADGESAAGSRTVGDLLTSHPQASTAITAIDAAITAAAPDFDSQDNATVTLSLPLERVWQILQSLDTPHPPEELRDSE